MQDIDIKPCLTVFVPVTFHEGPRPSTIALFDIQLQFYSLTCVQNRLISIYSVLQYICTHVKKVKIVESTLGIHQLLFECVVCLYLLFVCIGGGVCG